MNSKYTLLLFITLFSVSTGWAMEENPEQETRLDEVLLQLNDNDEDIKEATIPIRDIFNLPLATTTINPNKKIPAVLPTITFNISSLYWHWKENQESPKERTDETLVSLDLFLKPSKHQVQFRVEDIDLPSSQLVVSNNNTALDIEPMLQTFEKKMKEKHPTTSNHALIHFLRTLFSIYENVKDSSKDGLDEEKRIFNAFLEQYNQELDPLILCLERNEAKMAYRAFMREDDLTNECEWILRANTDNKKVSVKDAIKKVLFPELEETEQKLKTMLTERDRARTTLQTAQNTIETLQKDKKSQNDALQTKEGQNQVLRNLFSQSRRRNIFAIVGATITGLVVGSYLPSIGSTLSTVWNSWFK